MKSLVFCLFLIPTLSFAQNGGVGIFPAVYLDTKHISSPAVGLHVSGNGLIGSSLYLGIQIGVVKFQSIAKVYMPIQARFTVIPSKKLSPVVTIEPGYGAYHNYSVTGGLSCYVGAGVAFPSGKGGRGMMTVGYSNFQFHAGEVKSNLETLGIRFGFMIF